MIETESYNKMRRIAEIIEQEIYKGFHFSQEGIKQTITVQAIAWDSAKEVLGIKDEYIRSTPYWNCDGCGELVISPKLCFTENGNFCFKCIDNQSLQGKVNKDS